MDTDLVILAQHGDREAFGLVAADLATRFLSVSRRIAEGHSNQAIGARLFLSLKTVETHIRQIFMKLGLEEARDYHRRVLAVLTFLRS